MRQCVVWMDGKEAKIMSLKGGSFDELVVAAPQHHVHRHPHGDVLRERQHPDDEQRFFKEIAQGLSGQDEILLVGPAGAKLRFFRFVRQHERVVEARIVGVETADHPTDRQIVAHARRYFDAQAASDN